MVLGKQHHIAVICSNWDAAREFYVNKLGFELIREVYRPAKPVEPAKSYHVIARGAAPWRSPGTMYRIEPSTRRLPRPCRLAMTVVIQAVRSVLTLY